MYINFLYLHDSQYIICLIMEFEGLSFCKRLTLRMTGCFRGHLFIGLQYVGSDLTAHKVLASNVMGVFRAVKFLFWKVCYTSCFLLRISLALKIQVDQRDQGPPLLGVLETIFFFLSRYHYILYFYLCRKYSTLTCKPQLANSPLNSQCPLKDSQ